LIYYSTGKSTQTGFCQGPRWFTNRGVSHQPIFAEADGSGAVGFIKNRLMTYTSIHKVTKLLKSCFYLAVFIVVGLFESKINSIFGISAKNCMRSDAFWQKKFSTKNRPEGDRGQIFEKIKEELRIEIRTLCVLQKVKQNYRQIYFNRAVSKNRSAVSLYMSFS
jgi:hypothetical protein